MQQRRRPLLAVAFSVLLVASLYAASGPIGLVAPFTGDAWAGADEANPTDTGPSIERAVTGPTTVESPHGEATVRYDDQGVPHIEADSDAAMSYAAGYAQARDRLFQLDLQRRLMRGELAEAFGPEQVESDRFHRQMDFAAAAEASWEAIEDEETRTNVEAYADGVNAYADSNPLPMEFAVAGYEPDPWQPEDTLLVGKLVSWGLTGSFADLEQATVEDRLPDAASLYPDQLDHDTPVVRDDHNPMAGAGDGGDGAAASPDPEAADYEAIYDAIEPYEPDAGIGSNSWVVAGTHTDDGHPVVANDPHLELTVPPIWYEMHLQSPDTQVRGVAFPGMPVVVIGATDDVAWGFTNVGADVLDVYEYEWVDDETYRYRDTERTVESRTETINVAGAEDETVDVQRTVHGALIEREDRRVGVSWLGMTGTREAEAVYQLNQADDIDDVRAALRRFDLPTQNIVAADSEETLFRITGQYPVRTADGEVVAGDRIFNGSAGHGEWDGFEPYGVSDFAADGFADFERFPEVRGADYVATANQRTMNDPPFYIARSTRYADPYRGERIYERLDERAESGEPMDRAFHVDLQRDTYSERAATFLPQLLALDASQLAPREHTALSELASWDRRMEPDSEAALVFTLWLSAYREATWGPEFDAAGLDESYYPADTTLARLDSESEWFDNPSTRTTETREDIAADALSTALDRAEAEGYGTYGDYSQLELDHEFPLDFLDYDRRPMAGSPATVFNFRPDREPQAGMSWRMVVDGDGGVGTLPGGQSGNPLSTHYDDRLDPWATGGTEPMAYAPRGPVVIEFAEVDG
ncbi:peptidase S45 family protein [Natronomonas pharaonis DSM 2160]|uniref:Peptidase S45 family protein n=1 Tax=Natronomonas pharaonis (strain ATCC 35678 / DSM 2160 / CIP 103997 / JCM 8858 / NBRC 14720 / NCIMB 2260 / Gabara) TaxID=348780 RepID=A0A1U7EWL3_NATPD|nr:penicillin acylase family protein [Natronomonas pharaonis]CAI49480.1 peptidase S45 family protein [Natronomonas pharaonis DSM 2160]